MNVLREAAQAPDETMVDVALPVGGAGLARDHAEALAAALAACLPWLADEPAAGVHPIKLVPGVEARGLLSRRARLLLRVPRARLADLQALAGRTLDVDGGVLQLGAPSVHELLPHGTLYAPMVATGAPDEAAFMQDVEAELRALGIQCHCICGRARPLRQGGAPIAAFSLMLHGLGAEQSLRVQTAGIGRHRQLGCGVFVPHKSAAPVGA